VEGTYVTNGNARCAEEVTGIVQCMQRLVWNRQINLLVAKVKVSANCQGLFGLIVVFI